MMDNKNSQLFTFKRLSLYTILAATPSLSYAAPALEEIIVTARKASESLQTTPVAVTALTQEMMIEQQIVKMDDLQRTAPSLSIGTGGTGPASIIYASIRGQAQNSPNSVTDAAVGIYIDGVYLGRPIGSNMGFLDVAQAEVLRGPQGTLFGRNTTGGALNITTNRPTADEFSGHVKAEVGNYSMHHVEAVVNIPIIEDELATRFAYRYNERDGYYDNPNYSESFKDVDGSYSARASVMYTPDDSSVEIFFSIDHEYYKDNGTPTSVIAFNDNASAAPGFLPTVAQLFSNLGYNPRDYEGQFNKTFGFVQTPVLDSKLMRPSNYSRGTGMTLDFQVDIGEATLKSITAYRDSVNSNQNDLDGSPVDIISFFSQYKQHQFTQELQLSGDIGDSVHLIGGVYHFQEGGDEFSHAHQFGALIQGLGIPFDLIPFSYRNTFSQYTAKSQGAFIQANVDISEKLRLTAGYRYTQDERNIVRSPQTNYIPAAGPIQCGLNPGDVGLSTVAEVRALPSQLCHAEDHASFGYPAYLLSLDYQLTDDIFMYFKHSRASMAGSLNTREVSPGFSKAVDPETVKDFEIGFKGDFFDSRLRANLAVYHLEGEDVQRIINAFNSAGTGLTQFSTNTGDTEIEGIELEITALLWEGFELNASMSVMDSEYQSGTFLETRGTVANPIITDRSGEELPRSPDMTYSIGATQTFNLDIGELRAHMDYSYVDDQAVVVQTATPGASAQAVADVNFVNKNASIEGYGLLNAMISLNMADFEFAVWGRNLTDEEYTTNVFESWTALGFVLENQGTPRTYGASVTYRF